MRREDRATSVHEENVGGSIDKIALRRRCFERFRNLRRGAPTSPRYGVVEGDSVQTG